MVFGFVKRIFKKKEEAIDLEEGNQSITHPEGKSITQSQINQSIDEKPISLQKDALELGLAAGYAGRSLKSIESSLERMESLMVTKDWMSSKLEETTESHEENEQKRFETLVSILNAFHKVADISPPHVKDKLVEATKRLEEHGKITPRMQKLIDTVKELKETNYKELAARLGISDDGLRGLVSLVCRECPNIQRFEKGIDRRKWVRYVESPLQSITQSQEELTQSEERSITNHSNNQ